MKKTWQDRPKHWPSFLGVLGREKGFPATLLSMRSDLIGDSARSPEQCRVPTSDRRKWRS